MKSLGLLGAVARSNIGKLDRPYKLNYAVTYMCQSRCTHCSIWQLRPKGELTLNEVAEFARRNSYFSWVELTGGEPFLRLDIVDIARAFAQNCGGLYLLTMPTNSLCNYDMEMAKIEEIAKLGIPNVVITVSLDGYRELEDGIRGVPGNYDRAIRLFKGIKALRGRYPNLDCTLGYTIIKRNVGQLERTVTEVMRDVPDATYSDFHVNLGQISDNYYGNAPKQEEISADHALAVSDVQYLLGKARGGAGLNPAKMARGFLETRYMEGLVQFLRSGSSPIANRDGELSIFMDSYGNVYPSIMTSAKIGSIRENGYDVPAMLKGYNAGARKESYYTACEIYQSILGSILKR